MTFDTVLEVFAEYLREDTEYEVVLTSRGYAVMGWDDGRNNWNTSEHCATPEDLLGHLLDAFSGFRELEITGGDRPLTEAEEQQIDKERQAMAARCR